MERERLCRGSGVSVCVAVSSVHVFQSVQLVESVVSVMFVSSVCVCASVKCRRRRLGRASGDWVEHHGGRPRFSAVKKVLRFFPTFGRHKGLHLVRTLAYATEEPKEEREEENRKIFLDQSAFD